ncbi:hypothetical protein EV359DRAFT_61706 [Lentinula novae-zelandiae]|nr:hypothetical protein EV359DRAFT_61706 [Lentinula novae-zelandiae]
MTTNTRVLILSMTVESGRETCGAVGVKHGVWLKDEDTVTIQVEDLPKKRSPCVNLKTLEGWKDFHAKSDVLLTEDDSTSPEPSRKITFVEFSPASRAAPMMHYNREYSEQDLVAIYEAIGGYVFIHSKINILPMTSEVHTAWDHGLILIYIREQKYDGREVKVGFSPKLDLVEKGIAGFKYCSQTRAHPILLLGTFYKSKCRGDEGEVIISARGDKGDKRGKKGGKGDTGGKKGDKTVGPGNREIFLTRG